MFDFMKINEILPKLEDYAKEFVAHVKALFSGQEALHSKVDAVNAKLDALVNNAASTSPTAIAQAQAVLPPATPSEGEHAISPAVESVPAVDPAPAPGSVVDNVAQVQA